MNNPALQFWQRYQGLELAQGDYLTSCLVPVVPMDVERRMSGDVPLARMDLIVVTQSCDLANRKANFVALCPIFTLHQFQDANPHFASKNAWEEVRKGRREGLHMLGGPDDPENNRAALIVDFRQIYSLPFEYLTNHAEQIGARWRLQSPFLEHFSQAFARFFMRVGLPSSIPTFK